MRTEFKKPTKPRKTKRLAQRVLQDYGNYTAFAREAKIPYSTLLFIFDTGYCSFNNLKKLANALRTDEYTVYDLIMNDLESE